MRVKSFVIYLCLLLIPSYGLLAEEQSDQADILAQRGSGILHQSTFEAYVDTIPEKYRHSALRDRQRLQDIINSLLLKAQLAAEARQAGFDTDQIIVERMKLAAESELAEVWLQHYLDTQPEGDYEQLAREYYQLNQEKMLSSAKIDVSHILISTKDRPEEEAEELADSLSRQLAEQPSKFDQFVKEYSEDPSAASNGGRFKSIKKGDMVKPFEEVAFALQEDEVSSPVKTGYGYHIIRLDAHIAREKKSFDEVKERLIKREREQHQERVKQDYLGRLTALNVEMTEAALQEMIRRQTGENYSDSPVGSLETE